jgi:hypothetical protein
VDHDFDEHPFPLFEAYDNNLVDLCKRADV